jgi:hypothetical protein
VGVAIEAWVWSIIFCARELFAGGFLACLVFKFSISSLITPSYQERTALHSPFPAQELFLALRQRLACGT